MGKFGKAFWCQLLKAWCDSSSSWRFENFRKYFLVVFLTTYTLQLSTINSYQQDTNYWQHNGRNHLNSWSERKSSYAGSKFTNSVPKRLDCNIRKLLSCAHKLTSRAHRFYIICAQVTFLCTPVFSLSDSSERKICKQSRKKILVYTRNFFLFC